MIGYTHGKQAYKLLDTVKQTVFSSRTDQWEGLIPENAHYPDQNTLEEDDPDPQTQNPNESQMEPHLQEDVPRAVEHYLHGDVLRAVGAPDQLRHPPQQSLQPRPEHWLSSERKLESQSVGGQRLNIQPADVEKVQIQLDCNNQEFPTLAHNSDKL
ncbi:hypothetical protein SERLA73DRAFT_73494 [Serpula lacrymans var. lacrymans S7.3]|uniref:Uncharacterized protein n=1 Tax=Serpula lacrymans var. lacrymans (strain S7.3) TaxID=936435 RepID=F8PYE5_SERL3|nr:hypothetical protein SERLA73DRAFT_73494 [Serpula lacrymans var. lacrymans S7.3]